MLECERTTDSVVGSRWCQLVHLGSIPTGATLWCCTKTNILVMPRLISGYNVMCIILLS
jgi:hypothetical protein